MPKDKITIATAGIERKIAFMCRHLGLDPQAHGAGTKAIREALTIAATVLALRQQPAASDQGGGGNSEEGQ